MSTSAAGGRRTARHYISRFRCPTCQRRFAKPTMFVRHVAACGAARVGSHAQPCRLTWCKRPECRHEPLTEGTDRD